MGKRKRKLSAAARAAKKKRRLEYEAIFINGKMKRVRRPPTIDGISLDEFVRTNADPIVLHQEGLWDYLEAREDERPSDTRAPAMTSAAREPVSFITLERGEDLIVAYAIALDNAGEIASLILQRTPKYEVLLPPEERGVAVSHELFPEDDREMLRRITVEVSKVDIQTTVRTYLLDLSAVDPEESAEARKVLRQMHRYGSFELALR
jgi:hypothetical protein